MGTKTEQKLLYTVKEIFHDEQLLKEKQVKYFSIPYYQRGYKWDNKNILRLLDDINSFKESDGKFYCIQNITVIKKDDYFNVIDGQQRLTTLTILLSFLEEKSLVSNKVRFPENSIRKFTNKTLNDFITNQSYNFYDEFSDWENFVLKNSDYDLQDIFHIFQVANSIKQWFTVRSEGNFKINFKNKLLNHVKVIVNEVEGNQSEEKIFGNLNSKRIPLDGSDLIRAILITRVAREEAQEEADLKNIIFVNERRIKLGWELDQINSWWSDTDVKDYFEKFISIKSEMMGENKLFNDTYPINNLYLLYAEIKEKEYLNLDLIESESKSSIQLYKDLINLNDTLQDWFKDREIYHYLGYLFSNKSEINFKKIYELWKKSEEREIFIKNLKLLIKPLFFDEKQIVNFIDFSTNWYDDRQGDLIKTLLFLDVIESVKTNRAFLPPSFFKKNLEDIEHIFPKIPRNKKNNELIGYTKFLLKAQYLTGDEIDLIQLERDLKNEELKNSFIELLESKTSKVTKNSIGNLVLLHRSLNRSIGNKSYGEKRSKIISYHNDGNFIQPHTFKVFIRDFMKNGISEYLDSEFWIQKDIEDTANYIQNQITNFFTI